MHYSDKIEKCPINMHKKALELNSFNPFLTTILKEDVNRTHPPMEDLCCPQRGSHPCTPSSPCCSIKKDFFSTLTFLSSHPLCFHPAVTTTIPCADVGHGAEQISGCFMSPHSCIQTGIFELQTKQLNSHTNCC